MILGQAYHTTEQWSWNTCCRLAPQAPTEKKKKKKKQLTTTMELATTPSKIIFENNFLKLSNNQALSQNLKSGHPKCATGPAQMGNLSSNI